MRVEEKHTVVRFSINGGDSDLMLRSLIDLCLGFVETFFTNRQGESLCMLSELTK
jgi:hypothetical protein